MIFGCLRVDRSVPWFGSAWPSAPPFPSVGRLPIGVSVAGSPRRCRWWCSCWPQRWYATTRSTALMCRFGSTVAAVQRRSPGVGPSVQQFDCPLRPDLPTFP